MMVQMGQPYLKPNARLPHLKGMRAYRTFAGFVTSSAAFLWLEMAPVDVVTLQ